MTAANAQAAFEAVIAAQHAYVVHTRDAVNVCSRCRSLAHDLSEAQRDYAIALEAMVGRQLLIVRGADRADDEVREIVSGV